MKSESKFSFFKTIYVTIYFFLLSPGLFDVVGSNGSYIHSYVKTGGRFTIFKHDFLWFHCCFLYSGEPLHLMLFFFTDFGRTFDDKNQYTARSEGPIVNDTIVVLDAATGALKDHWGSKMFYMPHGLDVDASGNIWVTDVAMHQVFKVKRICL